MQSRPHPTHGARHARNLLAAVVASAGLVGAVAPLAVAQQSNPVYVDDSLAASEALARAGELSAGGNHAEASRVLQRALDDDAERLLVDPRDPDLFRTVRDRVREALLSRPALLDEYRAVEGVEARRLLDAGDDERVERTRLLTTPGLDAALRVAQRRIERAQFWSALRVLEQLPGHPDLRADKHDHALRLARRAAGYIAALSSEDDTRAAEAIVASIARAAGASAPDAERLDAPRLERARSPFDHAGEVSVRAMLSRPLWSIPFQPTQEPTQGQRDAGHLPADSPLPSALGLQIIPTIAGDTIFLNSGDVIAAFDRYTLAPRWPERRFEPSGFVVAQQRSGRRGIQRIALDDTSSIAVSEPWAVAVTGTPAGNRRLGDPRVHALDTQTGVIAWSRDISTLDPGLEGATVKGRPLVSGGVVVLAASRQAAQRRLESVQLVGLDLSTGALLWRTPLASAGALPYNASVSAADHAIEWRGLALRADEVGVVAAVDAASGRPSWIRRTPRATLTRRESWPYESHAPVVVGEMVYSLSADSSRLFEVDGTTGALRREFDAQMLGGAKYLLVVEGVIFSVSETSIARVTLSDDAPANARGVPRAQAEAILSLSRPGLRGRVVPAQGALVAPFRDGVIVVRLDSVDDAGRPRIDRLTLDRPGTVLPVNDQLVVVDDAELHTYLLWETAERQLLRRIEAEPDDPTAAVVYAELAYRAEKPQTILPALRLAVRALDRDPISPVSRDLRARLFASLVAMLTPEAPASSPVLPREVRAGVVDAVATLASTPSDRATALLLRGEHAQTFGDVQGAVAAYQGVLDEPSLSSAQLRDSGVQRSASEEVTRRLRGLVREHGPHIYARYDAEASDALGRLGLWSDASAFEDLARRYPVSASAARALMRASEAHQRTGQNERAVLALEQGLLAARDALIDDRAMLGELGGRLVLAIQKTGRHTAAHQALARLLSEYGEDLPLSAMGEPLNTASLRTTLAGLASDATRLARVGPIDESAQPQALMDWSIAEPLVRDAGAPARAHVVLTSAEQFSLFAPTPGGKGGVEARWSYPRANADALVRLDDSAAYFTVDSAQGRILTRIDARTGAPVWSTPAFRSLFGEQSVRNDPRLALEGNVRTPPSIETPVSGRRSLTELLVVFDERTMALVERSGRAAAFDLADGSTLWTRDDLPAEVYDIAAEAGVLILGGAVAARDPAQQQAARIATVVSLDLRTGRTIHETRPDAGRVRWVRPAGPGRALVGFDAGVLCNDAFRGTTRWFAGASALRESVEAWVVNDRVFVMDPTQRLWQLSLEDGAIRREPLDSEGRLDRGGPVRVRAVDDRAAFASIFGLIVFGPGGEIAGRDAALGGDTTVQTAFVDAGLLAVDIQPSDSQGQLNVYRVRRFSSSTAALQGSQRIALGVAPSVIAAIDGRILVTAGNATIVYDAPVSPARGD